MPCVQPKAFSVQLRKYSYHRLANDNDATDQNPVIIIIDTATSNGVSTELFPIVQVTSGIHVDENSIEESSCEPDLVVSSNNMASVTGTYKTIITGPRGESLHKEELSVSRAERLSSLYQVGAVVFQ